jgi:hypothetical protein
VLIVLADGRLLRNRRVDLGPVPDLSAPAGHVLAADTLTGTRTT